VGLTDVEARRLAEPAMGIFIAEGAKVIDRAVAAGHRPLIAVTTERWLPGLERVLPAAVPIHLASDDAMRSLTGYRVHRGALVAFERPADRGMSAVTADARRLVVMEDLKEHTNVGAIARSAAALDVDALVVSPECADPLYRRAIKTSMGATLELPFTRCRTWPHDLAALRSEGWVVAALTPAAHAEPLDDFAVHPPERLAWLIGTEGSGLSQQALDQVEVQVRIPMRHRLGVDSLNAAAAAAIACYALRPPGRPADDAHRP
jgi:tRNA G18 (ribose-2'-O)-methylase SpoU